MGNNDPEASYYGILPANVRYDKRLKPMTKIMYTEITCLSNKHGFCYAKNYYFSNLYGVSKETVSRWVSELVKYGYVNRVFTYKEGTKDIDNRFLTINPIPIDLDIKGGIDLNINRGNDNKINTPIDEKIICPIDEKIKDNSTSSSNNTSNNIEDHFKLVWKLYPKKLGKGKISAAKKKAMIKYTIDQWKVIIKRYDSSVLDKTFLMHGSSFFNVGYVDYIDENYQEQKFAAEKKFTNTEKYNFKEQAKNDKSFDKVEGVDFMKMIKNKKVN